jgi:hypothetical protein
MTMSARSPPHNAALFRWSSTRLDPTRSNRQPGAQLMHRSSSFDAAEHHPSKPLMRGNAAHQRAQSPRLYSGATSAAIKSP